MANDGITIRLAGPDDLQTVLHFIRELAEYEKLGNQVVGGGDTLAYWMFERKVAECLLVFDEEKPVGFALYFYNFSTFLARAGIYIEDVYVVPAYRNRGIGKTLFRMVARKAVSEGCGRMEWWCLKWNQSALDFYHTLGAEEMSDWMPLRLSGDTLKRLAEE